MGTQIVLRDLHTNNKSLAMVGNIVRVGLRGAWRFGGGYESAVDISGNETQLIEKGKVSFTNEGVIGDLDNGFKTNLAPSVSRTFIAVVRVPASVSDLANHNAMVIGNFTDASESAGGCIWYDGTPVTINSQTHYSDPSRPEYNYNASSNRSIAYQSDANYKWLFVASVVDADTGLHYLYCPTLKNYAEGVEYSEYPGLDLANRTMSPHNYELISTPDTTWGRAYDSVIELSEALIYDRGLTLDEVKKQYEYSKEYHAKVKGISI